MASQHPAGSLILVFCGLVLSGLSRPVVAAEPLPLLSGEYAPYTGEKLPGGGVSTRLVQAIFESVGYDINVRYYPWPRTLALLKAAEGAGGFPYAFNREREQDLLYSTPLHRDRIRFFASTSGRGMMQQDWTGQIACVPQSFDLSQIDEALKRYRFRLERPTSLESCFRMLSANRVDLVPINERVGRLLTRTLLGANSTVTAVGEPAASDITYFVIPRKWPGAQQLMDDFNRGLAAIRADGRYKQITEME